MTTILVGDIGGTNSRLRLLLVDGEETKEVKVCTLPSNDYPNFETLLRSFLQEHVPVIGIFAVAGVALGTSARFVNQAWIPIDVQSSELESALHIKRIVFLNDFEAAGYGCLALNPNQYRQLNESAHQQPHMRKVVMGPGTGLGEALLTYTGSKYLSWPGEGGHSDFSPHSEEEWEFSKFMMNLVQTSPEYEKFRPCEGVSFEVCCAGVGAFHIYEFFRSKYPQLTQASFDELWESSPKDRMRNMMEFGFSGRDELCKKSVELWLKVLAYECGNLVAKNLPFGGVYLIGGLVCKNFQAIYEWKEVFLKALKTKPKHICEVIDRIPIYLVSFDDSGMEGTILYAKSLLSELGTN